ncbi:VOC family protein [Croceicoccus sp. BE223]|uniref:VOC family protein n=1 Tax=Croceicoccus sp. BE223 TaxID=2817716 RepID=UPI002856EC0E|nr:VOC family protein [Croceicoccus sp. BE223]MDR7102520.1 catechol 2,3-dioxygenase-like lactoylglutathione lyase family enzyme [Croceicoccus sp. BE223]
MADGPPALQSLAVVTLGTADAARSRRFYGEGFGWRPVFEQADIAFYQMNGFVLGIWDRAALAEDMQRPDAAPGAVALAHNVATQDAVIPLLDRLVAAGGTLLRPADAPPHGGFRGYVADPDGHAWEIAWNPAWPIDDAGHVTFRL